MSSFLYIALEPITKYNRMFCSIYNLVLCREVLISSKSSIFPHQGCKGSMLGLTFCACSQILLKLFEFRSYQILIQPNISEIFVHPLHRIKTLFSWWLVLDMSREAHIFGSKDIQIVFRSEQ